jgi:sulfonate transport system substrate-binding protein
VAEADPDTRVLTTAEGIVASWSYFLGNGDFVAANPQIVVAILDELQRVGVAAQADLAATVPALSAITGVPEDVQAVVLNRTGADLGRVGPITPEVIAYQQALADEFHGLGILPRALTI